jgi:hypothetical protein
MGSPSRLAGVGHCDESGASAGDCDGELQGVGRAHASRRPQLSRHAQMIAGEIDHLDAAAAGEHGLVPFGQFNVSGAVGNDKDLEQSECGGHELEYS